MERNGNTETDRLFRQQLEGAQWSDGRMHIRLGHMLEDPALSGGADELFLKVSAYLRMRQRNDRRLLAYLDRLGMRGAASRLGFFVERHPEEIDLVEQCLKRVGPEITRLDTNAPCPQFVSRWKLFVPAHWTL